MDELPCGLVGSRGGIEAVSGVCLRDARWKMRSRRD